MENYLRFKSALIDIVPKGTLTNYKVRQTNVTAFVCGEYKNTTVTQAIGDIDNRAIGQKYALYKLFTTYPEIDKGSRKILWDEWLSRKRVKKLIKK